MSEEYNGWANRETWAFVLHCDNTIGTEFLSESFINHMTTEHDVSDYALGQFVIDIVESMWDEFRSDDWVRLMRDDVGSVWRIDLREIGAWAREYAEESARYAS